MLLFLLARLAARRQRLVFAGQAFTGFPIRQWLRREVLHVAEDRSRA